MPHHQLATKRPQLAIKLNQRAVNEVQPAVCPRKRSENIQVEDEDNGGLLGKTGGLF